MNVDNIAASMQQLANACGLGNGYLNDWINTDDQPYRSISNDQLTELTRKRNYIKSTGRMPVPASDVIDL